MCRLCLWALPGRSGRVANWISGCMPPPASLPPIDAMTSLLGSHNPHSCSVGLIRLPGVRRHTEEHDDRCPNSRKRQDLMKQVHIHGAKKPTVPSGSTKGCNHLAAAPPLSPVLRMGSHHHSPSLQTPILCAQHSARLACSAVMAYFVAVLNANSAS